MTLDDLNSTLGETLASEKIGIPVSLRLHLQLPNSQQDPVAMLTVLMQLAETVFKTSPTRLMARQNNSQGQLNVLFDYASGPTLFITCGCGCAKRTSLHLLLLGNRGIVRLEGGDLFDGGFDGGFDANLTQTEFWRPKIQQSVESAKPVFLE